MTAGAATMAEKPPDLFWTAVIGALGGGLVKLIDWLKDRGKREAEGTKDIMTAFTDERRRTDHAIERLTREWDERIKDLLEEVATERAEKRDALATNVKLVGVNAEQTSALLAQSHTIAVTNEQMQEMRRENRALKAEAVTLRAEVHALTEKVARLERAAHIEVELRVDGENG